jgi:hypothetical protein
MRERNRNASAGAVLITETTLVLAAYSELVEDAAEDVAALCEVPVRQCARTSERATHCADRARLEDRRPMTSLHDVVEQHLATPVRPAHIDGLKNSH